MNKMIKTYKTRVIKQKQKIDTEQKNFRISAKRIFITYSQVDTDMTALDLLELLNKKFVLGQFKYVIAKELHNDGNTHFHVVLINEKKFEIKNPHLLDIQFKGQNFHGNYQSVRLLTQVVQYVCKNKEYISNIENLQDGKILDDKEFVLHRAKIVGYQQALLEYSEKFPKKAFSGSSVSALKKNFRDVRQLQNSLQDDIIETPFTMENFDLKGTLKQWVEDPKLFKEKALILVGESGIGKTQFAKAFCKQKKWKTLLVSHKEDFQRIDTSYDAIIIDDANFNDFDYFQKLALLDNSVASSIRVLYQTVRKKQGVVTMLLMNHKPFADVSKLFDYKPFARRIAMYQPEHPFMINVYNCQFNNNTYYIQNNNNHNHNANNQKQAFQQHLEKEEQLITDNRNTLAKIRQHPDFLAANK